MFSLTSFGCNRIKPTLRWPMRVNHRRYLHIQVSKDALSHLHDDIEVPVYNYKEEEVGKMSLKREIFGAPIRPDILHRVVVWQLAKRRQGSKKLKDRSEVSGSGRKPWPQKGQGRARAGSLRAPQFRGGGRVHPPRPRDWSYPLQKKVRRMALRVALSARLAQGKLVILDDTELPTHKTAELDKMVEKFGWGKTLIVDEQIGNNLGKASFKLHNVDVLPHRGINVYDILHKQTLVLSKKTVEFLQKRLSTKKLEPVAPPIPELLPEKM